MHDLSNHQTSCVSQNHHDTVFGIHVNTHESHNHDISSYGQKGGCYKDCRFRFNQALKVCKAQKTQGDHETFGKCREEARASRNHCRTECKAKAGAESASGHIGHSTDKRDFGIDGLLASLVPSLLHQSRCRDFL